MVADAEVQRRTELTRDCIQGVLQGQEEALSSLEILKRIDHPISNGMSRSSIGYHCSRMEEVERVTPNHENGRWAWAGGADA